MDATRIGQHGARGAAAAALLLLATGCGRFSARMELRQGNEDYRNKKYPRAVEHYQKVAPGTPEGVDAALNLGYAYMAQYKWGSKHPKDREVSEKAVEAFSRYLELRPGDADAERYPAEDKIEERIISLLIDSERYEQAISRLQAKLEREPKNAAILGGLASAYEKWGKPTVVLEFRQRQAELLPSAAAHATIAAYSWNISYRQASMLDTLERNRWVDVGLEAAERALQVDAESLEGLTYKNLLLRERAKLRTDPDEVAALVQEAQAILTRVNEMRKKIKEQEDAAKARAQQSPTPGGRT